jgi:hypothetical protein
LSSHTRSTREHGRRKGLVTDVSGPQRNACSGTLTGSIQVSPNPATLNLTFANPLAGSSSGTGATISIATPTIIANDPHMRSTYVNEWTFDIQHSVGRNTVFEIGYVGNQGHRLKRELGINIPQPGSTAAQSRTGPGKTLDLCNSRGATRTPTTMAFR